MTAGRVSILVPSRNEQFLAATLRDILAHATGDIDVIAVLDGYWDLALPSDPRLTVLHVGTAQGMRPAINAAVAMSTGQYLLKCDGHVSFAPGFDEALKADYHEDHWVLVPRRYPLDPERWGIEERADHKYPIDAHFLSEPFDRHGDSNPGFHGSEWRARRDAVQGDIIEDLSSQGSCWFMSRAHFDRVGPLDAVSYGSFVHEFQELGLKTWLSGGAVMVSRSTHYLHLYKGKRYGRGYGLRGLGHEAGTQFCSWFWGTDQPFKGRIHNLQWLIERFSPVPTWPDDLDAHFARMRREFRSPYAVAA